jgi:acyl-CoA synthetase (AMP-forming)/AMP-acid ligase II
VLGSHDQVELVAVVGAPHAEWGETPVAVIVPRGEVDAGRLEAELRELCRRQLGGYKQPRSTSSAPSCRSARPARCSSARSRRAWPAAPGLPADPG